MQKENIYILEVCKYLNPDKKKICKLMEYSLDYPYILGQLLYNRVGAIAYYTLSKCELLGKLNREFRNTLKSIYQISVEKSENFSKSLTYLDTVLENFDCPYACLKGTLLSKIYPVGLRTSNDIDILLNSSDISDIDNILSEKGFLQGNIKNDCFTPASRHEIISSRMNRGETMPYIKAINLPKMDYLEIDINFSLDYKATGSMDLVQSFLKNRVQIGGSNLSTLSQVDFLIHLCVHLYKEATVLNWVQMGRDLSLYKFCDIYMYVTKFMNEKYANDLIAYILKYGLQKECYYSFLNTRNLFNITNKCLNFVIDSIRPNNLAFLNSIYAPGDNKYYSYSLDFCDWIFCSNRKDRLHETSNV